VLLTAHTDVSMVSGDETPNAAVRVVSVAVVEGQLAADCGCSEVLLTGPPMS
jgi:hypothetical protein